MDNFYVITNGAYSDYEIDFIIKSHKVITKKQMREYYLESIKRSSDFDDKQRDKLAKYMNDSSIKSTDFYNRYPFTSVVNPSISYQQWHKLCEDAGVKANPYNWLEGIFIENGCEIIDYKEFNPDSEYEYEEW